MSHYVTHTSIPQLSYTLYLTETRQYLHMLETPITLWHVKLSPPGGTHFLYNLDYHILYFGIAYLIKGCGAKSGCLRSRRIIVFQNEYAHSLKKDFLHCQNIFKHSEHLFYSVRM